MEQVRSLVIRAAGAADRDDRISAYGQLVERFRDMACGYAYSILGDFHLAEDAAQDAFVTAYRTLGQLRDPDAFPGWFRRIVWSACGQIARRKTVPTAPIDAGRHVPSAEIGPSEAAEKAEMRDEVLRAISQLPAEHREVTALFYINGYSQKDIADFLEVPVGTVKNRLTASRGRLKERMLSMVKDTLHKNAPDERFDKRIIDELLSRPRPLELPDHPVRRVWDAIRQALADYEVIEGPEVIDRSSYAAIATPVDESYQLDRAHVLRPETTVVTFAAIAGRRPPVRLLTTGRVFRTAQEDRTHMKVFHQADLLHLARGLTPEDMKATVRHIIEAVLGPRELRWEAEDFPQVQQGAGASAEFDGQWTELVGCGMLREDTLRAAGHDPRAVAAYAIGLGLERLAMLKFGIDDIRKLWQPPYVP